jgi:hypothetical protein
MGTSAVAATSLLRYVLAAVFPLFTSPSKYARSLFISIVYNNLLHGSVYSLVYQMGYKYILLRFKGSDADPMGSIQVGDLIYVEAVEMQNHQHQLIPSKIIIVRFNSMQLV